MLYLNQSLQQNNRMVVVVSKSLGVLCPVNQYNYIKVSLVSDTCI